MISSSRLSGLLAPLLFALAVPALQSCSSNSMQDLNQYVTEIKARKGSRIEPIPEIKPYESYSYDPSEIRDPFESLSSIQEQQIRLERREEVQTSGIRPDFNRNREELENHPLDSLRMVGTLQQNDGIWAIILASDGTIHRITSGNFLGQNHGNVKSISESEITLAEIVPDGLGGWMEREASMMLTE